MADEAGRQVYVYLLNYTRVTQLLQEDVGGLYINYHDQRVDCRPALNANNEVIPGVFIGAYPWLTNEPDSNQREDS